MMWLTLVLLLFIFQIATIMIAEFRNPSKGFAWLFILFLLPIIGFLVYYFIAQEYRKRSMVKRKGLMVVEGAIRHPGPQMHVAESIEEMPNPSLHHEYRLFGLLQSFPDMAITLRNSATVLSSAQETYSAMLRDIEGAADHIHLLYYIWNGDNVGRTFQRALIRKALEGVKVRIVYDGIGSYATPDTFWEELRNAGAEVHCFLPVFFALFDRRLNYRNHRKITVVDGKCGYIGGVNIGDEYVGRSKLGFWRDSCIRLTGDSVAQLQRAFMKDWQFVCGERLTDVERLFPKHGVSQAEAVQIVSSGPDTDWDTILEMFFSAFVSAKERIYITTPYFIPDRSILMALKTAALSGIDVRLIIPGIADSRLTLWASLSFLEELLQTGVRVYRYQKGFIHAKRVVVDRHFASVGTANMDMRSFYNNFEINAAFFDGPIVDRIAADIRLDVSDSREVRLGDFMERSKAEKAKEAVGRLFSPLL